MPSFDTATGGTISLELSKDTFAGQLLYLEIDQSSNINNTDDGASIIINGQEVRQLIELLHDFIKYSEGKEYFKKIEETQ